MIVSTILLAILVGIWSFLIMAGVYLALAQMYQALVRAGQHLRQYWDRTQIAWRRYRQVQRGAPFSSVDPPDPLD